MESLSASRGIARRAPRPWRTGLLLALTSCQTYQPAPLDREAHRTGWTSRDLVEISSEVYRLRDSRTDGSTAPAPSEDGAEPPFDVTDGVTLLEGRLVALAFNPGLRLARMRVGRSAAGAAEAGRFRDPALTMNLLRVVESFPDPWVVTPALTFSVPVSDRLDAERGLAHADVTVARKSVAELEWSIAYDVEAKWVAWSAATERVEQTRAFLAALERLVERSAQLVEAGELARTEGALFGLERSRQRARLSGLMGDAEAAEQELRRSLGLSPSAPVVLVPSVPHVSTGVLAVSSSDIEDAAGVTPAEVGAAGVRIESKHPRLARLEAEYAAAEEALRLEIAKQWPDLGLGPMFDSDAGQDRLGLTFTLPLPILNANRRAIAEARVDRDLARAALETSYELLVGQWAGVRARVESLDLQRRRLEHELVPMIEAQVQNAAELIGLGEASSLVLLESLTRAYQAEMDLISVRAQEARSRAELRFVLGPDDSLEPERPSATEGSHDAERN